MQVINFLFVQQQGNQIITGTLSISKISCWEDCFPAFLPQRSGNLFETAPIWFQNFSLPFGDLKFAFTPRRSPRQDLSPRKRASGWVFWFLKEGKLASSFPRNPAGSRTLLAVLSPRGLASAFLCNLKEVPNRSRFPEAETPEQWRGDGCCRDSGGGVSTKERMRRSLAGRATSQTQRITV